MNETAAASDGGNRVVVSADFAQLGQLRSEISRLAHECGAPEDIAETFELVVSELATNVILHTTSDTISIGFDRTETGWELVISDAEGIDLSDGSVLPDPAQLAGRGLFIVEAVMDEVELFVVDGRQHVRCIKHVA